MDSKQTRPVYVVKTNDRICKELEAFEYLSSGYRGAPSHWRIAASPFDPEEIKLVGKDRVEEHPVHAVIGARRLENSLLLVQMDRKEGDAIFYSHRQMEYECDNVSAKQVFYPVGVGAFKNSTTLSGLAIGLKQLLRLLNSMPEDSPVIVLDADAQKAYPAIGFCTMSSSSLLVFRYWAKSVSNNQDSKIT